RLCAQAHRGRRPAVARAHVQDPRRRRPARRHPLKPSGLWGREGVSKISAHDCHFDCPEPMPKRDFLAITDFSRSEIQALFDLAAKMKNGGYRATPLAGQTLAMVFAKSSTRTRVSLEVGPTQRGRQALS